MADPVFNKPVVDVPAAPEPPPFPTLADRRTNTYNRKAYDWALYYAGEFVTRIMALIRSVKSNADAAHERAVSAGASAATATAMRNEAVPAAATATEKAGVATEAAGTATAMRGQAVAAAGQAVPAAEAALEAKGATQAARDQAQAFATQQLKATSATEFANTAGAKNIALTANKPFVPNVTYLRGASRSNPLAQNAGYLTAYNPATGAATLALTENYGPATNFSDWDFGVGAPGGAPGISVVAPDTIQNCNNLPNNTITRISSTNSTAAAKNLPLLVANAAMGAWNYNINWIVETIGFEANAAAEQTATPIITSANETGVGCKFIRKRFDGVWGRWKPIGANLPEGILTASGGWMYGSADGTIALNRINAISSALNGQQSAWNFPTSPEAGDKFYVVTNYRDDNYLVVPNGGKPVSLGLNYYPSGGDVIVLDTRNNLFRWVYCATFGGWLLE